MIPENFLNKIPLEFVQLFSLVKNSNITDYPMKDYECYKKPLKSFLIKLYY